MKGKLSVHYRISSFTKVMLLGFAFIADGAQALLLFLSFTLFLIPLSYALSLFLMLFVYSVFGLVFVGTRVNPFGGRHAVRKLTTFATTFVLEFMPVLAQFIPSLTIWTWLTIRQSRLEDREKAEHDAKIREEKEQRRLALMRRHREEEMQMAAYQQNVANDNIVRGANDNDPSLRRPLPLRDTAPYPRQAA